MSTGAQNPNVRPAEVVYEPNLAPPSFSQATQAAAQQPVPMPTDFNPFAGSGQAPPQAPPAQAPQFQQPPQQAPPQQAPPQQAPPQQVPPQQAPVAPAPQQFQQPPAPVQPGIFDPGQQTDVLPPWAAMQQPPQQQVPPGQQRPAAPVAPEAPLDLGEYLTERGIDISQVLGESANPRQALDFLVDQAQLAQQYRQQVQQYQDFLAQQQGATPEAPGATPETPAPTSVGGLPELSTADAYILKGIRNKTFDPTTLLPEQRARLETYVEAEAERAAQIARDPAGFIWPEIEKRIREQFVPKSEMEQALHQQEEAQFDRALNIHYENDWFEHDASGRRVIDPSTGKPRMTPWGVAWVEQQRFFEQGGIKNHALLTQAIMRAIGPPPSAFQAQQAPQPAAHGGNGVAASPAPQPYPPQQVQTPQQAFVDHAAQMQQQYPGYPPAQRGGVAGQPPMGLGPDDLAPPRFSDVAREVQGAQTPW